MSDKPVEYNATISERYDLVDGLSIFRVAPDDSKFESFKPGQYIVMGLNHPTKGSVIRSYSIASPPHTLPDFFEFYIRLVRQPESDNPLTPLFFELKKGDRLHIGKKIVGKFTVADQVGENDPRLRITVAAGTGLAPFTSMVFDHWQRFGATDQYMILHGASYPNDLGYMDDLTRLLIEEQKHPRYFPTVSRDPGRPWMYHRGRVEDFFLPDRLNDLERRAGLDAGFITPSNAVVFICGLNGTIAQTIIRLLDRGFIPGDIKLRRALGVPDGLKASVFFEQYDKTPVINHEDEKLIHECRERLKSAGVELETPVGK